MKFDLVDITDVSGDIAHIYSVVLDGDENSLLEKFFNENEEYKEELNEIYNRLYIMGHELGCREQFFKIYEGKLGDGVAAIWQGQLRLYCLRVCNALIFVGSGGYKPSTIRAYQEDPDLNQKAQQMIKIAKVLNHAIIDKDITFNDSGEISINDDLELDYE